jgi:hypothetical protein
MIQKNRLIPIVLALTILQAPAALKAQTQLYAMTTQELYAKARAQALYVSDKCARLNRTAYLEAMSYLFAYYQVASRDGSLKADPAFDRSIRDQFLTVQRLIRKCFDMEVSSAGMRDDGTGAKVVFAPVPSVALPDPPPAGVVGAVAAPGPARFSVEPKGAWLAPGATQQFSPTDGIGRLAPIHWIARGGTITPGGRFTAGSASGLYRLIAVRGVEIDTAFIAVAGAEAQNPPPSPSLQR